MDEESEALFSCPDGSPSEGYMCTRSSVPVYTCEKEFTLINGTCVRENKETMESQCPAGTIIQGTACVEKIPVDLVAECPAECYKEGDECLTNRTFSHSFICPAGWDLDAARCVMEEMVDCTDKTLPGEGCGENCYVDMQCKGEQCFLPRDVIEERISQRKGKRSLSASVTGAGVCNAQACKVTKLIKSRRPDSTSLELVSKTCLKRTETDPEVFCEGPQDAVFNGKECCMQVPVPSVYKCPVSKFGATDGDCFQLVRRAPQFVCPVGFEQKCRGPSRVARPSRCECVAVDEAKPTPVCPEGAEFQDGQCVMYEEPIAYCADKGARLEEGHFCVKTVHEPVRLRTTITLECLGEQCFEKVRAEMVRANVLPQGAGTETPIDQTGAGSQQSLDQKIAVPDVENTEDVPVEIFTKKRERRRGRRCGPCPAHLETVEDL